MSSRAYVTIIIPTYNRADLLAKCLDSVRAQTFRQFHVLVVDDGSEEDIATLVAEQYPEAEVLRMEENQGFAKAVNAGLAASQSPYLFLLNNDMTMEDGCLRHLMAALQNEDADMAAPLVLWDDARGTVYSCGDRQRRNGRPEAIGFRCKRRNVVLHETPFGVSAGAALYRREVFGRIGHFDPRFVAYYEDGDLNFRARLAGFKPITVTEAIAYHVGSASLEGRQWWRAQQCCRNHLLLVLKNFPLPFLIQYAPAILRERVHQTSRFIAAARTEFGLAKALRMWLAVWLELWRLAPSTIRDRVSIQRARVLPLKDLRALLRH